MGGLYPTFYCQTHGDCTWTDICGTKAQFWGRITCLTDITDNETNKRSEETNQVYAERLIHVAEQAWPEQDLNEPLIARQMIECYTDGLVDNAVARKVMREGPVTFKATVRIAVQEHKV